MLHVMDAHLGRPASYKELAETWGRMGHGETKASAQGMVRNIKRAGLIAEEIVTTRKRVITARGKAVLGIE